MSRKLSKNEIKSFCGDVVTLKVCGAEGKEVFWSTDNRDAVFIREFKDATPDSFSDRVILAFKKEGSFNVFAEVDGEKLCCSVKIRKMRTYKDGEKLNFYMADLHNHTSQNHDMKTFPYRNENLPGDCILAVKKDGFLDMLALSDHGEISNNADFFRTMEEAEKYADENLVVFGGMESEVSLIESDSHGKMCKNSGEAVTFNCDNFSAVSDWEEFFERMSQSPLAVGTFAHPQVLGFGENGIWDFKLDKYGDDRMKKFFRLTEIGNGTEKATNMLHEYAYSYALDLGFKVSPTSSSDSHGPVWGKGATIGKTVILAPEKSKEMFLDAVLCNRVYATESGNVKFFVRVNGKNMGETLCDTDEYKFEISLHCFDEEIKSDIVKLEIISDGGESVYKEEGIIEGRKEITLKSGSARYFYVRVCDEEGFRTWSAPFWTGRAFDLHKEEIRELIDKEVISSATDLKTDEDAKKVINGDIWDTWVGKGCCAEIEIKLSKPCEVGAVGVYPYQFTVEECNKISPGFIDPIVAKCAASMAKDYEVFVFTEGGYKKTAESKIRIFGEENYAHFDKVKTDRIKINFLNTAGSVYEKKGFKNENIRIGNIFLYK